MGHKVIDLDAPHYEPQFNVVNGHGSIVAVFDNRELADAYARVRQYRVLRTVKEVK